MKNIKKLTLSALFLALGLVLPFLTMQIPEIGNMLLPMHIPVLLCGFVCGWQYGLVIGFITPLLRSAIFGMPFMIPNALGMAFELATYGAIAGILYYLLKDKKASTYISLIGAMLAGRAVWGVASYFIYSLLTEKAFTWAIFAGGAFLEAIPGIVLQLVIIPPFVMVLKKQKFFQS